jgi:signal transduction histidine kinase
MDLITNHDNENKSRDPDNDNNASTITRDHNFSLRRIPLFSHLSDDEIKYIDKGKEIEFEAGAKIVSEGQFDTFYALLDGEVNVVMKDSAKETTLSTFKPGDHFGELPIILDWSEHKCSAYAMKKSRILTWSRDAFWKMLYECPSLTREILRAMAQRLQTFETVLQQNQKLIALGSLAAGLAHELNNPAAAASRAVTQLSDSVEESELLSQKLNQNYRITDTQWSYIFQLKNNIVKNSMNKDIYAGNDPLLQSEQEDQITAWLESHGINEGWNLAPSLVSAGFNTDKLDDITKNIFVVQPNTHTNTNMKYGKALSPRTTAHENAKPNNLSGQNSLLKDILSWTTASIRVNELLYGIKNSTANISDLIDAVKTYSYMDQAPIQEIDVHRGIESTLTMLHHKLNESGITVTREYDNSLPHINAYGSELNQVWTNMIDNAIDSIGNNGRIIIRTRKENNNYIVVEITDDGPGIPKDLQQRLFEPFFTTKGLGKGTGLGLSISHRIVTETHKGEISVSSEPGSTCFQVRLPVLIGS